MRFLNRADAGRQLAQRLLSYQDSSPIVLALPRGGVVVAYEVARMLGAPLDVVIARKLGAPENPEYGIGAVAAGGIRVLDEEALRLTELAPDELDQLVRDELREVKRRTDRYRGDRPEPVLTGRTVLLVDDGVATGVTALAAIRAIRHQRPARLVLAVPVGAPESLERLEQEVDALVCLRVPRDFRSIGEHYRDFAQTSDEEVIALLERAAHPTPP